MTVTPFYFSFTYVCKFAQELTNYKDFFLVYGPLKPLEMKLSALVHVSFTFESHL